MKRIALILFALCLVAMALPARDAAAGPARVRVVTEVELPPPQREVVRERVYVPVPVRAAPAGCYGGQGGCVGKMAAPAGCRGQFAAPAGCRGQFAAPAGCYGQYAGAPYGARLGHGQYNTPSGRPAAPGIFSAPGAPFPADGPVRAATRRFWGFDE